MNILNRYQLKQKARELKIKKRILEFLKTKQLQGQSANTRQIAAALDIKRFTIVLMIPQLIITGEVVMTGKFEIHNGKSLACYSLPDDTGKKES